MSVVVLVLFFAVAVGVLGSLVAMYAKDKPIYGVVGICVLSGPGTVLAFLHMALA